MRVTRMHVGSGPPPVSGVAVPNSSRGGVAEPQKVHKSNLRGLLDCGGVEDSRPRTLSNHIMQTIQSHRTRPIVDELRELRDIARSEHGPQARTTRLIEDVLRAEEQPSAAAQPRSKPTRPERLSM